MASFSSSPSAAQMFGGGAVHALVRRCCGRATRLAIGVVYAIIKACISEAAEKMPTNFIDARPDRLPMGLMARRIDMLRDRPLQSLWNEVIERWVIAQHEPSDNSVAKRSDVGTNGPIARVPTLIHPPPSRPILRR
jgi:hypothetical protein